jgi:transposase, IS30 family
MESKLERKYSHLDDVERERIAIGLARGESLRSIGACIGRPASAVLREKKRNGTVVGYIACVAQQKAAQRLRCPRRARKLIAHSDNGLRAFVLAKLRRRRSPEQIAAELRRLHPTEPERWVSHQTIYTSIYILPKGELKRELLSCLRQRGKPRLAAGEVRAPRSYIHQLIHDRPAW